MDWGAVWGLFPPPTQMLGAAGAMPGNFTLEATSHPLSPAVQRYNIRTSSRCRARYAKPGNLPNAWPHSLHCICPTSLLLHLCPLAAEKRVVLRGCEQPAFCGHISTDRREMCSIPLLEDQKQMRPNTGSVKSTQSCPCSNSNWRQSHTTVKDGNLSCTENLRARAIKQN